jgi:site-specific DNA recombinase
MTTAVQVSTAVGYFRVSSPGQAGERHVSLEVQAAAFAAYCHSHSLAPVATFTDVASGRKDDRAQYRAMLAHIIEQGIGHVVVLFLDRFGRNPREILRRYWELQERGITVQSINEDLREELLLLVRAGIAGQESKRTSERVRLALREAASRGKLVSKLPFGYIKIRDFAGERVEQVPQEAEAIRLAYVLATVENKGYKAIADELNRRSYRTKVGAVFAAQSLKLILLNPAMAGKMVFRGQGGQGEVIINENAYPAILSAEEWDKLQQRLTIRREGQHRGRTDSSPYLLSGILRCGYCQGAMAGASKGPGKHRYYVCCGAKMARALCEQRGSHRKELLEEAILAHLGQYDDPEKVRELLQAQDTQTDSRQEQELSQATARLSELETGMLNDLDRLDRKIITEAEYTKRAEVRRREQDTLQARKGELEASIAAQGDREAQATAVPVRVSSFLEDFQGMDVVNAKAILQTILKAAHVWKDGRIELEFR